MIFQLFVLKHLTKTLCLFFLCFRPCSMPKHTLPPYVPREYTEEYILSDFSNVFSQKILINCVSLFLMLFSMFRSESLAIACSDCHQDDHYAILQMIHHMGRSLGKIVKNSWDENAYKSYITYCVGYTLCWSWG